jgi:threonine synthase
MTVREPVARSGLDDVNAAAFLGCRGCGAERDLDAPLGPCPACGGALEVRYDLSRLPVDAATFSRRGDSLWQYAALLPPGEAGARKSLGEGNTPLRRSLEIGPGAGVGGLWLKNETVNPTWAHKDRFHSVATAMAAALGYRRVVSSSTGNHGASMAAYAARAGLSGLVLCPPQVSPSLVALIGLYGGRVVVIDWDARDGMGRHLTQQHGWYPATGLDPDFAFAPNPYGAEGHKTIAYEIVRDLGGVPDSVLIPCAGGDTIYGVWKGFRELVALGVTDRLPRLHSCQPAGADVLGQTLRAGGTTSVVLEQPESIATSVRERTVGMHAVAAVAASGGQALTATDAEIVSALAELGREGYCVEPASALAVACLRNALAAGTIDPGESAVCLLTAAGIKWPAELARVSREPVVLEPSLDALDAFLAGEGIARSGRNGQTS